MFSLQKFPREEEKTHMREKRKHLNTGGASCYNKKHK
jgi:hypothetical protein